MRTKKTGIFDFESNSVGVLFMHKNNKIFTPNYIGLDYKYSEYYVYQQLMYNVVEHAILEGYEQVDLGVTADFEKGRIGATIEQLYALIQVDDHYNQAHIDAVHKGVSKEKLITV